MARSHSRVSGMWPKSLLRKHDMHGNSINGCMFGKTCDSLRTM